MVADRPASGALPGLAEDRGPGSAAPQTYLTRARCTFAHEKDIDPADIRALTRRLQTKLSKGWTVVQVGHQVLQPVSPELRQSPKDEAPTDSETGDVETADPGVNADDAFASTEDWTGMVALREFWLKVLPYLPWMVSLVLLTLAVLAVIWALRRLGRTSPEELALLKQLEAENQNDDGSGDGDTQAKADASDTDNAEAESQAFVSAQHQAWKDRFAGASSQERTDTIAALTSDLLRAGEMDMLAKAALVFPSVFPKALADDSGRYAAAKLELAEYIKTADVDKLPSDAAFFAALNRFAVSAELSAHADTETIRSLRHEFGAAGLAGLVARLPARPSALLFAQAPGDLQNDTIRLLATEQRVSLTEQLLISNRMSPEESAHLLQVLRAVSTQQPLPSAPADSGISDRGHVFEATETLCRLLPLDAAPGVSLSSRCSLALGALCPSGTASLCSPICC